MNKTEGAKILEDTTMIWSLAASKAIRDTWADVIGEDPMPWKSNFIVRSEMLWFFLHMMARYAFDVSPEARATLQDELVPTTIQRFIRTSFDSSQVKKGFDTKGWEIRMANEALEELNEAEMDYTSCRKLGVENEGGFTDEETVLGKLAARINNLIGQGYNIDLRLLIWMTAVESLAKSGLKEQVEEVIKKGKV
jgi:hypothetical protein